METAKVDIRKLQILNDRIAQVAEALNQVRLSVHGLSYASGLGTGVGYGAGVGAAAIPQGIPGLSHTTGIAGLPPAFGFVPALSPQAGALPYPANLYGGLSHSSEGVDPLGRAAFTDPILAQRVVQTFPYAWSPFAFAQGSAF